MKCPVCEGQGTTWMGLESEVECSYCHGSGEISDKKMYLVRVTTELVVWADDHQHARFVASDHVRDELHSANIFACDLNESNVPFEWEDGIPYGDAPAEFVDMTVNQVTRKNMEIAMAAEIRNYTDPNQLSLFGEN